MGYDMYWKSDPPSVASLKMMLDAYHADEKSQLEGEPTPVTVGGFTFTLQNIKQASNADVQKIREALHAAEAKAGSYFRSNIWGMGQYRDEMDHQGMGHWQNIAFPSPDAFKIPMVPYIPKQVWDPETRKHRDGTEADTRMVYEEESSEHQAYRDAVNQALATKVPGTTGIALCKFCSNDGWIVTPAEIEEALKEAKDTPSGNFDHGDKRWRQWLDFLKGAIYADGVVVW